MAKRPQLNVLYIEDDEDDFFIIQELLEESTINAYQITWAQDYEAGMAGMRDGDYDLCLVDYRLGGDTGLSLIKEARDAGIRLPMVLLTGMGAKDVDLAAMEVGVADYLVKDQLNSTLLDRTIRYTLSQHTAVERLKLSEQRLADAVEAIPEGFVLFDKHDRLVTCNSKYKEFFGLTDAEITPGITFEEVTRIALERGRFAEADGRAEAFFQQRMDAHRNHEDSFELPLSDGRWFLVGAQKTRDGGTVGIRTDITRLKNTEAKLINHRDHLKELVAQLEESRQQTVEASEQINSILNSIHDAFFAIDKEWRLTYANAQAEVIFERPIGEIRGQALLDIIPEFASFFYKSLNKTMDRHEPSTVEGYYPPLHRWFDMRAYPTKDGLSIYLLDSTDKRKAEEEVIKHRNHMEELVVQRTSEVEEKAVQLEDALKQEKEYNILQKKFVALVSHEFRTPLSIIDAMAQRLIRRKDKVTANEVVERADKVRSAVTRMVGLINTTLYASSLDEGKIEIKIEPCDIGRVLMDVCNRQAEISPDHHIQTVIEGLPNVMFVDPRLIDQAFTNLLSNAVKYAPNSPLIDVNGLSDGDNALITITDQGVGISEEDLPHMFQRFFRAKTAVGINGTGIGLSVVKEFVEMHGGGIEIDSVEGEGSTFTVRLPIGGADQ